MDQEDALEHAIRVFTNGKADPQPLLVCTTAEYDEQKSVILELKVCCWVVLFVLSSEGVVCFVGDTQCTHIVSHTLFHTHCFTHIVSTNKIHTNCLYYPYPLIQNGVALLPDLRICESSEALRGRGAEFRLLIECEGVHLGGQEWAPVKYALSEQFQVLSSRSKPNCKPEIPHIDDPVKNVEAIGDATVPKLERLMALARDMHIDLNIPFESITKVWGVFLWCLFMLFGCLSHMPLIHQPLTQMPLTQMPLTTQIPLTQIPFTQMQVGEFRELARLAAPDKNLQDKLRKVLALTKDQWKMAHEHSQKAVTSDHRMRVWYPDASDTKRGVVFECVQGNVLLNKPLGMITPEGLKLETQMHSDPAQRVRMKQEIEDLLPLAVADWYKDGHGTWGVVASGDTSGGTTASMMGAPVAGGYGMMPEQQQGMVQQGSPFFAMQQPQQARGAPVRKMMRQQEPPMFGGGATPAGDVPFDSVQFGTTNNVHALMNINNALHGGFADAWPGGAGIGGMTPSSAAGGPGGVTPPLAPSVFEQPGEQFQVMLAEILAQQAGAVGGEEVNDMKRKPSRGLSELFTSMSLQVEGFGGGHGGMVEPSVPVSSTFCVYW